MQWGSEQLEIIRHRSGNLLVSAAAGAGKTTVLVERIVQLVLDEEQGTDLDRMLIVTFTNLAAGQMKERVFRRLTEELSLHPENERLHKQLALLSRSSIMTIHSFCLQVVRRYIARIPELDPGFRVGEENETAMLAYDVLQEVLAEYYDRYDADPKSSESQEFEAMAEQFGGARQDQKLEPFLLRIYQFMQSLPEPWRWLEQAVERYNPDQGDSGGLYRPLRGAARVLRTFHEAFRKEKCSRSIVDYSDFEHYAMDLLLSEGWPSQAAQELRDQYDYIFIDEYQDSNEIQERILNSVAKRDGQGAICNVFMVGDVKQSIYGFRYACPELFLYKLEEYRTDGAPRKIFLQKNYRSRGEILAGVNAVFKSLMNRESGEIEYTAQQALQAGRSYPEAAGGMEDFRPRLHILSSKEGEAKRDKTEAEAQWAAAKIEEMLRQGRRYSVRDEEGGGFRPLTPGDIVILLRSAKEAGPVYQRALEERNIPASASQSSSFFDTREIRLAMSLLRIIDNSRQDIPMEGVLHSPLFGFTSEELARVRTELDRNLPFHEALRRYPSEGQDLLLGSRLEEFFRNLERWRQWSESLSVYELLLRLYRETGLYEYVSAMPDGARRRANLDLLLVRGEEFEKGIYSGLFQFLRFIDRMKEKNQDYEEASGVQQQQSVQILTVHKSKGLEFPVVFLCGMGRQFQLRDAQGSVLLHSELGIGARFLDTDTMLEYETPLYQEIKRAKLRQTLAEEMRILYVALTRAKDRLIVSGTGTVEEGVSTGEEKPYRLPAEEALKARTPLDWLTAVLMGSQTRSWEVIREQLENLEEAPARKLQEPENAADTPKWSEEQLQKLLWEYPYSWRNQLPALVSVSQMKAQAAEDGEVSPIDWESLLRTEPQEDSETFQGVYGGTVFHEVLAQCNPVRLLTGEGRRETLLEMKSRGILTEEEYQTFPEQWLKNFGESSLCQRMAASSQLLREESFMCGYTPQELAEAAPHMEIPQDADSGEMVVVQGILDAAFLEDGKWILVDYKTDRHFSPQTLAMYRSQLEIYSRALHSITGIEVSQRILYQVRYGKEYFV